MSIHDTRNWVAEEGTDFSGGNRKLSVKGEVQVGAANQEPVLDRATPQGIVKDILLLDLQTRTVGDVGADVLVWKPVSYEEPVDEDQYRQVQIGEHATVEVQQIIS